jgi:hypothetical protein
MKYIRYFVWVGILSIFSSGCAELTKFVHQKDNNGYAMKGDYDIVRDATMKALQDQGYSCSVSQIYTGPDGQGRQILAKKTQGVSLENAGIQVGLGVLLGAKNQQFHSGTVYDVIITENREWDAAFKNAIPEVTIFNISGAKSEVDQNNKVTSTENINNVDLESIRSNIEKQVQAIYQVKGLKY